MIKNLKMRKFLLVFILIFFYVLELFSQCNIESVAQKEGSEILGFTIIHDVEYIEDDAVYDSNGNRLTRGMRLTMLTTHMKVKSSDFLFNLFVSSGSTYPNEPIITPKVIQFVFTNDTKLVIKCIKYSTDKLTDRRFTDAEFILSVDDVLLLLQNDIHKMVIIDDLKQREVKLKLPYVFSRQIRCCLDEADRLSRGDTSNVRR